MSVETRNYSTVNPYHLKRLLRVRKAEACDIDEIFNVAASVGTSEKLSEQGFLVDDYLSRPAYYKKKIKNWEKNPKKKFTMIIVSPYVLIQERLLNFH